MANQALQNQAQQDIQDKFLMQEGIQRQYMKNLQ